MSGRDDIAIVGMSCLFPGAADVDAYWANILGKVDSISDPPPEAWDTEVYFDAEFADTDKVYCQRGGYLGALAAFDPLAYGIPPVAVGGEPDQWLALKLAYEALDDADALSLPADVRARTGIILGKGTYLNGGNAIAVQRGLIIEQTLRILRQLHPEHDDAEIERLRQAMKDALPSVGPETVPGLVPNIIVGRIANRLDLMGPAYTVDAACASSLLAVQLAQRHLLDGDCDLMLAGGSQVWMPVPTLNVFSHLGALSRRQQIRPFDQDADGTLLGEGIGLVVLKRAADARRDGDRIYAVVKSVGVASDGRGTSVMAPRVDGEELALRRAYDAAGVSPHTVGLLEAHGTATPIGDAVEMQALTRVFGPRDGRLPHCAIGTVKSMISHTIPASGVAGLIKTALALHHRVLPPTLNCDTPNPNLELDTSRFYINTETRPWIHGGREPRRAGVNSFGFGGINAHAILEAEPAGPRVDHLPPWDSEVVIIEAADPVTLLERARDLATELEVGPDQTGRADLTGLAAALAGELGGVDEPVRLAIVARSLDDLGTKLAKAITRLEAGKDRIKDVSGIYYAARPLAREGRVVLVFPGEGSQYPNMLADLCLHFPEVREAFDQVDRVYADHPRGHVSSDWIFPRPAFDDETRREADRHLMQMDIAVEAVLTGNQAVHSLLTRLGVRWDACLGHSTGEFSAAKAAGVLAIDDDAGRAAFSEGLYRCYAEADAREGVPKAVLLAIGAGREAVDAICAEAGGDLMVAMDNCPHQVVLVGEPEAAERARAILQRDGHIFEQLPYDRAVHTPAFEPFATALRAVFAELEISAPTAPLYSCTTGAPYPDDPDGIRELMVEHWTSPVEFRRTIEGLHDDGARVFIECGPRGNLTAFIEDILRGRDVCAVPADLPRRTGITQLNHLVGMLAVHGVGVDVGQLFAGRTGGKRATERSTASATVSLATPWPMLRLPDDVVAATHGSGTVNNGNANGNGNGNGHPADPIVVDATAAVVAPDPSPTQPAQPGVPVGAPARQPVADADAIIEAHFARMTRFLAVEGEVMRAHLDGPAAEPTADPTADPGSETDAEPVLHPLLGGLVHLDPGAELVTRRTFDAGDDLFLQDHRLGDALAVMPLTMSLALLAEAASVVAPDRVVTGVRQLIARRWLAVGDEPQTVEISARRVPVPGTPTATGIAVKVELHNLTEADTHPGRSDAVVEATILLDAVHPAAPAPATLTGEQPSTFTPDQLYRDVMFHGPRWQGVRAVTATAPGGVRAELEVLALDDFVRATAVPPLALDPVVLDAAGQLVGFWTAEHLDAGKVVFPYYLDHLDVFGPARPVGEALTSTATIELVGDQRVRSDIDVVGADGRVWMRLGGWEDKRFTLPDAFLSLAAGPTTGPMSTEWAAPLAGVASDPAVDGPLPHCRRIDTAFPAERELWRRIWAQRVLSRTEREVFEAGILPEPRRLERLGARTAAKEAVQLLVREHRGLDLDLTEIEITADPHGRPCVGGAWLGDHPAPVVSLAHSHGHAVALAGLGGRLGIDLEQVRPLPDGFAETAFAPSELALVTALTPAAGEDPEAWLLRAWCAKEAVAKALGTGLGYRATNLRIEDVDPEAGRFVVSLVGAPAPEHAELVGVRLITHTRNEENFIVAITLGETEQA